MNNERIHIVGVIVDEPRYDKIEETNESFFRFKIEDKSKNITNVAITSLVTNDYELYKLGRKVEIEARGIEGLDDIYQATKINFIPSIKYNKNFNIEFEKAKKRFNDIALHTGREHLIIDNLVARRNGAKLDQPEAYPEEWTLADLVAESDYQANMRKEMLDGCDIEEKNWIRKEFNRWNNFKKHYLPLVKEMNIQLFCNHCSELDVNNEDTIFYKQKLEKSEEEELL